MLCMNLAPLFQIDPHITSYYLILGYSIMWLIGFAYVMYLWNQQRNMQRDIQLMKQILTESKKEKTND